MSSNRNKQPVPLKALILKESSSGNPLFKHLDSLRELQSCLQQHIDSELLQHICIANYRNEILTLNAKSANWATRLRYSIPKILESIRANPLPVRVKSIRVIVAPEQSSGSRQSKRIPFLSQNTAKVMEQIADSIYDAELSASIRRLCRNSSVK